MQAGFTTTSIEHEPARIISLFDNELTKNEKTNNNVQYQLLMLRPALLEFVLRV